MTMIRGEQADPAKRIAEEERKEAKSGSWTITGFSALLIVTLIVIYILVEAVQWLLFNHSFPAKTIFLWILMSAFGVLIMRELAGLELRSEARNLRLIRVELKLDDLLKQQKLIQEELEELRKR